MNKIVIEKSDKKLEKRDVTGEKMKKWRDIRLHETDIKIYNKKRKKDRDRKCTVE